MNTSVRIAQQTSQAQPGTAVAGIKVLADTDEARMVDAPGVNYFQRITFFGFKVVGAGTVTANVGNVSFGVVSGELPIILATASEYSFTVPVGQKEDLYNIFVKAANADDGVYYIYY